MTDRPDLPSLLTRREALSRMALLMGGAVIGAKYFLSGTRVEGKELGPEFSAADLSLMDEIGGTIIPPTDSPGAKAVHIGTFMAMMVDECYDAGHQAIFQAGLGILDAACVKQFGQAFVQCSPADRTTLLNALDGEERELRAQNPNGPAHYFHLLKQLAVLGYFTSEIGCTQALRYVEVPGSFNGNVPYKKGDRAWFNSVARPIS